MALFNVFWAENHLHIEIMWVGTGREWVAMGTIFYSHRCIFCRTISLPSFNSLRRHVKPSVWRFPKKVLCYRLWQNQTTESLGIWAGEASNIPISEKENNNLDQYLDTDNTSLGQQSLSQGCLLTLYSLRATCRFYSMSDDFTGQRETP